MFSHLIDDLYVASERGPGDELEAGLPGTRSALLGGRARAARPYRGRQVLPETQEDVRILGNVERGW